MRDIVNSNGFSASTLQTNSKAAKMPNNSSGTLTRADYRSYRDFVGSYGDNKNSKDDQESVSSTESGISSYNLSENRSNNTSTSSLNSEGNGTSSKNLPKTEQNTGVANRTGSFRNYLEGYNNKKFSSVKPVARKQNTIKSEIVIQVNDPLERQKSLGKNEPVFVTTINGDEGGKDSLDSFAPPPSFLPPPLNCVLPLPPQILNDHQNKVYCFPPPPPPPFQEPKCGHDDEGGFIPPPPPQLPNSEGGCAPPPPPPPPKLPDFNKSPTCGKKWGTIEVDEQCPKSKPNQSEKLPAHHAAATNLAKILTQHLLPRRKALESQLDATTEQDSNKATPSSPPSKVKNEQTFRLAPPPPPVPKLPQNGQINNTPSQNYTCFISVMPPIPSQTVPTPPKLPPTPPPPKIDYCTLPRQPQKPTVEVSAPKLPRSPPPKVETHFIPKQPQKTATVELLAPKLPQTSPPKAINGRNSPLSPSPKIDYSTFPRQPPKLPRSPPPKVETHFTPRQPQKTATLELSAPKLPQTSPPKAINGRDSPSGSVDFNTTTVVPISDATTKVSKNDPNVRKLVYNTYRGLLGAYNNKANDMIATLPRSRVREDQGVSKQLESMAQAPSSSGAVGHAPSARLKSDIPGRTVEPPLCVQNAMLTKDKKPFTYTPGGIDLSEIRSPRMARRLELNAMNEGVGPVPQTQHPNYPTGPLPPSALAAMQPQLQVQVFPAGGIPQPHHHGGGGPPPPPPPPSGVPPPPPKAPPMMRSASPVPLDAFERPDMTKIIPENPMAMLRKTSGPVIKRDPIFNKNTYDSPPPLQPQPVRQPELPPQSKTNTSGLGSIYVPPVNQNTTPPSPPHRQPQSPPFANQREPSPSTARSPPAYYKRQPSLTSQDPPNISQRQPPAAATPPQRDPQTPDSPKATLSKAPTPWLQKRPQQQPEAPEWAVNDRGRDSPVVQEQQKPQIQQERPWQQQQQQQQQTTPWRQQQQQPQQEQQSPPQAQSPPWQQRQQKQPESQPWQQRQQQPEAQPWQQRQQPQQPEPQPWQQQQQQQRQPQSPPWQQQQQAQSPPIQIPKGGGVRKQVNIRDRPQESGPVERTEVVIVNEPPQVFHHPGTTQRIIIRQAQPQQNNYQQQQQRADGQGARIIPVQRDGASSNGHANSPQQQGYVQKTPTTPGSNSDARSLNRQLSWNSNPTQSNTFRVLQKITNTDGDDDEDQPVIEHSPKMPQHFPQRQVSMKQNDGDQELMNKFKQEIHINEYYYEYPRYRGGHIPSKLFWMLDDSGLDQDSSLHNEVDPRYRGPHIPSKAFKLLQSMTGGPDVPLISSTVPQGQQNNSNRGPKVRTIPIQIEGDGPTKTYVPPSEQTVSEPKKYMGSSIPGRSFKILQAMTGPDDCANPAQACENNENYPNDPSSYMQWGYDPNYPPPSPYYFDPYWGYYSQNYPAPNNEYPNSAQNNNPRMTPIPSSWGYYPPNYGQSNTPSESSDSNTELNKKRSTSSRTTPIPWSNDNEPAKKQNGNARCTPVPFWPYYYPNYSYENAQGQENQETQEADANGNTGAGDERQNYQQYPPYWDPYYYGYYYGAPPPMYPPVYSPYPFYPAPQADTEEVSGYSSNDEMAFYGARFAAMTPSNNTQARPRSTAPPTPSLQKQLVQEITQAAKKMEEKRKNREEKQKEPEKIKIQSEPFEDDSSVAETSDSDGEMVGYEVCRPPVGGGLKAIRSVSDIKVYDEEESSHCSDEEEEEEDEEEGEEESENTTEENDDPSSIYVVDENIPHQLSVIFEESERTDSAARYIRESSVATTISEDTATIENSDDEEAGESDGTVLVKLPLTFKISAAERQKVTLVVGNSEIKPQVAEKTSCKEEMLKSDSGEHFLKADRNIMRQVSSDSYHTADSDGETFYNTQNSNAITESINIKDKVNVKYNESKGDVDWWGKIDNDVDLLKSAMKLEEQIITKDEDIPENNSLKQDLISTVSMNEDLLDAGKEDEQSIYPRPNSSSSDEDFWSNTVKEECYETTPIVKFYNVDTTEDITNKDIERDNTEIKNDNNEVEETTSKMKVVNDLNVQEGMEKMEAVLTSIISTINSRTSPCCSDDDKSDEVDFWAQIINSPEKPENDNVHVTKIANQEVQVPLEQEDTNTSSACSRNSSLSKSNVLNGEENVTNGTFNCLESENQQDEIEEKLSIETQAKTEDNVNQETEEELTCDGHIVDNNETNTDGPEPDLKLLSVQERIRALQDSASCKHNQQLEETEIKIKVKERISALEDGSGLLHVEKAIHKRKSISRKSSLKSYEEYSEEEEGDSGVTSDISRHISETDTDPDFSDLKKLNKYQRASTHSRLFKLLQDECDTEDVLEDSREENQCERMQSRRELLNLPLQKNGSDPESFSSSGFTSPGSPTVNDRLVNELIQSLLRKKQGRIFKHMTMEKVQAAALRILQEDMDGLETLSSSEDGGSFLSPKKPGTGSSTPAQTPQEYCGNFNEYSQYYDSWAEAERLYEGQYDVLPSKAFRLIQEHAAMNRPGAIGGLLARCPRVLSNKNVQKELVKLMESHESPSPSPDPPGQPPDANQASNAS